MGKSDQEREKFDRECKFVDQLVKLAPFVIDKITNPRAEFGEEGGIDDLCLLDNRKIGIQVTEYNPDQGLLKPSRKSSRAKEKAPARKNPGGFGIFRIRRLYHGACA
jgi:hypothetical protein